MNIILITIIAFLTGVVASLGLGGGMVLIIYLTVFAQTDQLNAQGINLVFFIPVASLSLIIHTKNKLVEWKRIIPSIICGGVSAFAGIYIAKYLGSEILTKLFAVFIILIGLRELFSRKKPDR